MHSIKLCNHTAIGDNSTSTPNSYTFFVIQYNKLMKMGEDTIQLNVPYNEVTQQAFHPMLAGMVYC